LTVEDGAVDWYLPAAQDAKWVGQDVVVWLFSLWYLPGWQEVHILLAVLDGVDAYLPAAHVDHAVQLTPAAAFCAWYWAAAHAAQLVDVEVNAKPAEQKLQNVPVYDPDVWYFPVWQFVHILLAVLDGVDPYLPAAHVDHAVHPAPW
jgi:hypothetical protein